MTAQSEVKFLHCADIHLDMPFSSLGADAGRSVLRRRELKEGFRRIIDLAEAEQVDLLLVCGDLFEYEYVKKSTLQFVRDQLDRIPHTEVLIIPGNHDPYTPESWYRRFSWPAHVHILAGENRTFYREDPGVCVYAAESGTIPENAGMAADCIRILMLHGTLDMNFSKKAYHPVSSEALERLGTDYVALGHFHSRLQGAGSSGRIFNPGSPEPLGFDEEGDHGVFVGTLRKDGQGIVRPEVRFVRVNRRSYHTLRVSVSGCGTDEQAAAKVMESLRPDEGKENFYQFVLRGTLAEGFRLNPGHVADVLGSRVHYAKVTDETVPGYNLDEIAREPGLRGLFARKLLERAERAAGEKEKQIALQALYYGLEALETGKVDLETGKVELKDRGQVEGR